MTGNPSEPLPLPLAPTGSTFPEPSAAAKSERTAKGFYRPELDALRLFAFLCIFICHGPRLVTTATMAHWRIQAAHAYDLLARGFAYSLCLFFLLSAYLISELLLREVRKTGTIHLKAFYMRRILRIWPLYYVGVACAVALSVFDRSHYHVSRVQIAFLLFFVGWLIRDFGGNPMGPLWSISVEELFYLMWPSVIKLGGTRSLAISSAIVIPLALLSAFYLLDWYNPLPHFLFFATGSLLALVLHKSSFRAAGWQRWLLFAVGLAFWIVIPAAVFPVPHHSLGSVDYACMNVGCIAIFLSFYDLRPGFFPKWVLYLGQITYGLYVFHLAVQFYTLRTLRHFGVNVGSWPIMFLALLLALGITVVLAAASQRWLEQPFLQLKNRFTFIRSGAAIARS